MIVGRTRRADLEHRGHRGRCLRDRAEVGEGEAVPALRPAQDKLGREVHPSVFAPDEWRRRVAEQDHFVSTTLREAKLFVMGDERKLEGLTKVARAVS